MDKKKVTIIGDTSSFHSGSELNYNEFRNLIRRNYEILNEIPYNAFGVDFIDYSSFFSMLKKSRWWSGVSKSDILIVHGEGLTEKHDDYVYPYLYFSKIANKMGIKSWLVNFSMYEALPFLDLVKRFDYIASRDILTQSHLKEYGIDSELSFDCCVLASDVNRYTKSDGHIAMIRGRNALEEKLDGLNNVVKYNCCWKWDDKNVVTFPSFLDYKDMLKKAKFSLSTSFHGNILSYLSGILFISLDKSNRKYLALDMELLPKGFNLNTINIDENVRKAVNEHFLKLYCDLRKRALLNCI
jgi:hypothetical protein